MLFEQPPIEGGDEIKVKRVRANETKILDEATGRVSAVVSSESIDRDGDVIRASGWSLKNFMQHPIVLANHDYTDLESVIGTWEKMEVVGTKMHGQARFFIGKGNRQADWAFELAKERQLAFSVGFIPDMDKAAPLYADDAFGTRGMEFKGQELLEVSAVTVPSNPDALQRMIKRMAKAPNLHPAVAEIVEERLAEDEPALQAVGLSNEDIDAIADRVLERFNQAAPPDDDDPGADDDEADEDDYGDGDEPEAREASPEEPEFDAYAVAAAAAEEALEEELV
jgi:hypothetical protein